MKTSKNWYSKYRSWFAKEHSKEAQDKRLHEQGYDMWEEHDVRKAFGAGFKEAIRIMEEKNKRSTRRKR